MKRVFITILLLTSVYTSANAQGGPIGNFVQQLRLWMNNAIDIRFVSNFNQTGPNVSLVFNNVNDYASGVESGTQQIIVKSNKKFQIEVKTSSSNFSYSGNTSPAPTMPVNTVLGLKVIANQTGAGVIQAPFSTNTYAYLSSTNQDLIDDASRGGLRFFSVKYKATPGFTYPAGNYSVDVVYTATQK